MMKTKLIILALLTLIGNTAAFAQQQRVARVHYAGNIIFLIQYLYVIHKTVITITFNVTIFG